MWPRTRTQIFLLWNVPCNWRESIFCFLGTNFCIYPLAMLFKSFASVVLNKDRLQPLGATGSVQNHFWLSRGGKGTATGIYQAEAREAAKYSTVHRTVPDHSDLAPPPGPGREPPPHIPSPLRYSLCVRPARGSSAVRPCAELSTSPVPIHLCFMYFHNSRCWFMISNCTLGWSEVFLQCVSPWVWFYLILILQSLLC